MARMRAARGFNLHYDFAGRVIFSHHAFAVMRDKVIAVGQPAGITHIRMPSVLAFGQESELLHDFSIGRHFQ